MMFLPETSLAAHELPQISADCLMVYEEDDLELFQIAE